MKVFSLSLKSVALAALTILSAGRASALIQATIKPSATQSAVDIYFKSDVTTSIIFGNNVQVSVGIPNTTGASPTPQGTTLPGVATGSQATVLTGPRPNIVFNNLQMAALTMYITNVAGINRYVYLFNFTGIGTSAVPFTAGVEVKMLTIQFQNVTSGGSPNIQSLESLANGGGGGQTFFYVEGVGPGDITNSTTPFYNGSAATATNGGCNDYSCASRALLNSSNPLPIHLASFDAVKADEHSARITWQTASEQGSDYFEVERSAGGSFFDKTVAHVKAAGVSAGTLDYVTYDRSPVIGMNYYRLKMVSQGGLVTYSQVKSVRFDGQGGETVSFYPNPVTRANAGSTGIQVNAAVDQTLNYTISDAAGRLVSGGSVQVTRGVANYGVEGFDGLAAGTYYLNARGATINANLKIAKTE